jgi:hypothetical protein
MRRAGVFDTEVRALVGKLGEISNIFGRSLNG